jgi:hypothetical protein
VNKGSTDRAAFQASVLSEVERLIKLQEENGEGSVLGADAIQTIATKLNVDRVRVIACLMILNRQHRVGFATVYGSRNMMIARSPQDLGVSMSISDTGDLVARATAPKKKRDSSPEEVTPTDRTAELEQLLDNARIEVQRLTAWRQRATTDLRRLRRELAAAIAQVEERNRRIAALSRQADRISDLERQIAELNVTLDREREVAPDLAVKITQHLS